MSQPIPTHNLFIEPIPRHLARHSEGVAAKIEHEVGVSSRTLRIPRLDSDYFDE